MTSPAPASPVREQIKNLSGTSKSELLESVPDSTALDTGDDAPKVRRKRAVSADGPVDPNMADPKYARAVAKMTAFGGARIVKGGFKVAAVATGDASLQLNPEESEDWDDYFYVVSKKSSIDPTRPWVLVITGMLMLIENVVNRAWKDSADSFVKSISNLFGLNKKEEETETEKEEEEKA